MTIETIKEELKKRGRDETDVLDYSASDFINEFQRLVDFYNKTIENHYIYKIYESIFYIQNDTKSLNAFATTYKKDKFNTVKITGGLVMFLMETFVEHHDKINEQIERTVSKETIFFEEKFYFQYTSVFHFVIYHELGHLIQFGSDKFSYMDEFSSNKDDYNHERHIYELDADEFAALSLGTHLIQYFDQVKKKKELKQENVIDYISVSLGAIFIVMVNLHEDFEQFYVEKRNHPHPITRLVLLSLTMIEYLNQTYMKDNFASKLDHLSVINKAIEYANIYNKELKSNSVLEKVPSIIKGEFENVMKYIEKTRKDAVTMQNLAVKAWNERATK